MEQRVRYSTRSIPTQIKGAKMTFNSFKEYTLNGWIEFYTHWRYAPLWEWVVQVTYLVSLVYFFMLSINGLVYWMDSLNGAGDYIYNPIHELVFWGWMFGTVAGVFIYHWIYSNIAFYIVTKLGLDD